MTSNSSDKDGIFIGQEIIAPYKNLDVIRLISRDMPQEEHNPNIIVFNAEPEDADEPWKFGLSSPTVKRVHNTDVYFKRPSASFLGFVAFCPSDIMNICKSYLNVNGSSMITVEFDRDQLSHWESICEGVSRLVSGWIVKDRG